MTIFGICNLVPSASRSPANAASVEEQQQHSDESAAAENNNSAAGSSSETTQDIEASASSSAPETSEHVNGEQPNDESSSQVTDDDSKQQLPHGLLSSFVQLTENDEDDDDIICGASVNTHCDGTNSDGSNLNKSLELVPSGMMSVAMGDHMHDEGMHDGEDLTEHDMANWTLDGSGDSGHGGLLSSGGGSGGLGSGTLAPFSSRAHAAAAFGRLAKRAITFEDLIAAVDCFTAAYGQLETTEQRIVIARMYFLNRQLLYCQHDIIRQKQALAVAALQAKMIEAGIDPAMAGSMELVSGGQMLGSPETHSRSPSGYRVGTFSSSNAVNAYTSQFLRSMMAVEDGGRHLHSSSSASSYMMHDHHRHASHSPASSQAMLNTPLAAFCGANVGSSRSKMIGTNDNNNNMSMEPSLAALMTPSPILKPGMPLVTINTNSANGGRRSEPVMNHSNKLQGMMHSGSNLHHQQYHHPHHPQHQPQFNVGPSHYPQQQQHQQSYQHQHQSSGSQQQQPQPVRLDAKHLLLLQYLNNSNNTTGTGTQTSGPSFSAGHNGGMRSSGRSVMTGGKNDRNRSNIDVGIQVCLSEPFQQQQQQQQHRQNKVDGGNMQQQQQQQKGNNNNRRQQQNQSRGGRRTVVTWWPGAGDVGDEVMLPMPASSMAGMMPPVQQQLQPQQQQQQQQRRGQNNNGGRRSNKLATNNAAYNNNGANWANNNLMNNLSRLVSPMPGGDFGNAGGFFDDEMMKQAAYSGGNSGNRSAQSFMASQQQQQQQKTLQQIFENPSLIEQLLMSGKIGGGAGQSLPMASTAIKGGNAASSDMCSCHHRPGQAPSQQQPQQQQPQQQQPQNQVNSLSQQAALMLSRPLRRFDNCDIFDGDAPPQQAFA